MESEKEKRFKKKLADYTILHKKIMAGELPPRYVNCILINGWGNVFQEAVSCFLFSLFTDRAAIFNTGALNEYMPFQEAFPST